MKKQLNKNKTKYAINSYIHLKTNQTFENLEQQLHMSQRMFRKDSVSISEDVDVSNHTHIRCV